MKTENVVLMQKAKESLQGKWGMAIATSLIYMLMTGTEGGLKLAGTLISLVISGPMSLGLAKFALSISRNQEARFEQIFEGFNDFKRSLMAYLLVFLNVLVRLLLLIVPGIIAAISYSMVFYILADDTTISADEALVKSKKMMDGYKLKYFYLALRFFGLALLCILTLGIGFLWLFPFMQVTMANFYTCQVSQGC